MEARWNTIMVCLTELSVKFVKDDRFLEGQMVRVVVVSQCLNCASTLSAISRVGAHPYKVREKVGDKDPSIRSMSHVCDSWELRWQYLN